MNICQTNVWIFIQALSDDEDKPALNSYEFVIPEPIKETWNWYNVIIDWPYFKIFETGHFVAFCSFPVRNLVGWASYNTNDHLETWLQCPQSGCGAEGASNLNDLYAAEQVGSRKISNAEQFINATITNNV